MNFESLQNDQKVTSQNDFDLKLNIMDRFVKGVLIGNDKHQKSKMVVKLQRYLEMAQLLVGNQGEFQDQIQSKNHKNVPLPDEIWLKIMTYLNMKDLFGSVSLVNMHFYNLTCDSSAIKCITLKRIYDSTKLENAMKVLKRSKKIKHALVTQCDHSVNVQLDQILKSNENLDCLHFQKGSQERLNKNSFHKETFELLKKYSNRFVNLKFDYDFQSILRKDEYLEFTKMPNLKCFQVQDMDFGRLTFQEVLIPLAVNCKKLENIEFRRLYSFEFDSLAFDVLFEGRKETLKRISLVCFSSINQNILRNLFLCQNIEDLILKGRFLIRDTFLSISQLSKLKRLKIDKFPSDLFEFASWPSLERLWIEGPFLDSSTKLVSDESIRTLISRSPHL